MHTHKGMKSQKQIAWLMALGRGLRVEYDKRMQPLPPGLAALVEQFKIGDQLSTRQREAPEEKKSSACSRWFASLESCSILLQRPEIQDSLGCDFADIAPQASVVIRHFQEHMP
jgi:hypothetical protein